jgi:hypothetical protein
MLVIQGLSDVVAPPENGRALKADYPERVTLVEFAGLGHFITKAHVFELDGERVFGVGGYEGSLARLVTLRLGIRNQRAAARVAGKTRGVSHA